MGYEIMAACILQKMDRVVGVGLLNSDNDWENVLARQKFLDSGVPRGYKK
jgi:hypothetical protein